jgi:hypothetical protein
VDSNIKVKMGDEEEPTPEVQEETVPPVENTDDPETEDEYSAPITLEELPPDEELWPDGPRVKEVLAWKGEFGDIFLTSLTAEKHVIWRTMNRFEYKRMIKQMEQASISGQLSEAELKLFNEEYITELCSLYPKFSRAELINIDAGMPSIISQQVMEASGFMSLDVRQL